MPSIAFHGERKLKVIDVARETGLNRSSITALYYEKAERIELSSVEKLCRFFNCTVGDLFECSPDQPNSETTEMKSGC